MNSWTQLLNRTGWLAQEENGAIWLMRESEGSIRFLEKSLHAVGATFELDGCKLLLHSEPVEESVWLAAIDCPRRGRTELVVLSDENYLFDVFSLDTYIAGVVRQLNRLTFQTTFSCDGHGKRSPYIMLPKEPELNSELTSLFNRLGIGYRVQPQGPFLKLEFLVKRKELLALAQTLSDIPSLAQPYASLAEKHFAQNLEQLLSINGPSGQEAEIRQFVWQLFAPYVDTMEMDAYGNVLAVKQFGHKKETVLLNAHLDTCMDFVENRVIRKNGSIWSSSAGILGADDRAGIAVLLEVMKRLPQSRFRGTVKLAFTVEEEIGLVGASNVSTDFTADVDAAIVADRKGNGDIVTSCGGYIPFCKDTYGRFIQRVAREAKMPHWRVTAGGSSDTRIWAERGINSVNLSVGYQHEHTSSETVDVKAAFETSQLVLRVLGCFSQYLK